MRTLCFMTIIFCLACGRPCESHYGDTPKRNSVSSSADVRLDEIRDEIRNPSGKALVVAHRASWRNAPENSLAAIARCIESGVDIVEIDVRETRDGHLVLMHDEMIDRTTTGSGRVEDWDLDSLQVLTLKSGIGTPTPHHIPTLEDALKMIKGNILVQPDVKCTGCLDAVIALMRRTGTLDVAVFIARPSIEETEAIYGDALEKSVFLTSRADQVDKMSKRIPALAYVAKFEQESDTVVQTMKRLRKNGYAVWVQTIAPDRCAGHDDERAADDPDAAYGWLLEKGATVFLTDKPAYLLTYLRKKGFHD